MLLGLREFFTASLARIGIILKEVAVGQRRKQFGDKTISRLLLLSQTSTSTFYFFLSLLLYTLSKRWHPAIQIQVLPLNFQDHPLLLLLLLLHPPLQPPIHPTLQSCNLLQIQLQHLIQLHPAHQLRLNASQQLRLHLPC